MHYPCEISGLETRKAARDGYDKAHGARCAEAALPLLRGPQRFAGLWRPMDDGGEALSLTAPGSPGST